MSGRVPDQVVFLHGRGLGPESVDAVAPAFTGAQLLAPQGGVALRRGHAWFENERNGVARSDSVFAAEIRFLNWCQDGPLAGGMAWLCGFSNGGAFAARLLICYPNCFHGAALLSAPLVLPPWPASALRGKSVFYAHGDATDTVVDATFYSTAEAYLAGPAGCTLTLHRYPIAHVVTPEVVGDLGAWFAAVRHTPPNDEGNS